MQEEIGTAAGERVQVWNTGSVTGDMETRGIVIEEGAVLRGKSKFVKKTSRRSLLARRFPRTPKKPLPRIRRRPNNRRWKWARGERYEGRKNFRDHDQSK